MTPLLLAMFVLATPVQAGNGAQFTFPAQRLDMGRPIALGSAFGDVVLSTVRFEYKNTDLTAEVAISCEGRDHDVSLDIELLDDAMNNLGSLTLTGEVADGELTTLTAKKRASRDLVASIRFFRISVRLDQ